MDRDIEALKQIHGQKVESPQITSKSKAKKIGQAITAAKCREAIEQIAPNIAPESIDGAINAENASDIKQVISTESVAIRDIKSNRLDKIIEVVKRIKSPYRTCERCGWVGPEIKFHIAGVNGHINVCRQCIVKRRKANKEERVANTVIIGLNTVLLDFEEFPDLLEILKADAKRNFRTLQNEIFYRLVNHGD